MGDLVEDVAILIAEANNGGKWATHYQDVHKDLWRKRAKKIIEMIKNS